MGSFGDDITVNYTLDIPSEATIIGGPSQIIPLFSKIFYGGDNWLYTIHTDNANNLFLYKCFLDNILIYEVNCPENSKKHI